MLLVLVFPLAAQPVSVLVLGGVEVGLAIATLRRVLAGRLACPQVDLT